MRCGALGFVGKHKKSYLLAGQFYEKDCISRNNTKSPRATAIRQNLKLTFTDGKAFKQSQWSIPAQEETGITNRKNSLSLCV